MVRSNSNNLNAGMRCIKYMLFLINFMFVLTAMLLIIIGTTLRTMWSNFTFFFDFNFTSPSMMIIVTGCLLMIVALFGCMGAMKESTCFINVYGCFLLIIFILEISAAMVALGLKRQAGDALEGSMYRALERYPENELFSRGVDFVQINLECCGVRRGPEDWRGILPVEEGYDITVPESCCSLYNHTITGEDICIDYFEMGCYRRMTFIISQSIMLLVTGALAVAFVQLLGVICAFMLARSIRRTKSLREARRWQLQQSIIGATTEKTHYKTPYTQLEESAQDRPHEPVLYVPTEVPHANQ